MRNFLLAYIVRPFAKRWWKGFLLLALWTVAFVAMPALSGWFLAICSVVFVTANTAFAYLIPSSIIRLMSILRTATRYFERLENHKTTLSVQQSLQLKIFSAAARLPYFREENNIRPPRKQHPWDRSDIESYPALAPSFCSIATHHWSLCYFRGILCGDDCT